MIQWTAHNGRVRALGYSPDGAMLVSGSGDDSLRVWDPVSGEPRADIRHHSPSIEDLAFSPDGRLLVLATSLPAVIVCNRAGLRNGPLAGVFTDDLWEAEVSSIAFSPDGRTLVTAGVHPGSGSRAIVWDVMAFERGAQARIDSMDIRDNDSLTAAYSADGRTIALGSARGLIVLWPYPIPWGYHWRFIDPVAYDRHVWRSRVAEVKVGRGGAVRRIAFSPDGTTLAAAVGNAVVLWDYRHPNEKPPAVSNRRLLRGHAGAVRSLAFAADGRTIATASLDGTLRVWDTREAFELSCLDAKAGPLHSLAFAPDGMTVAIGSEGGDIVIIDVDKGL
jgi:WD40 repeat protein